MSENQDRGSRDFSAYDALTTEELEQLLRLDAEAPEGQTSDGELLLYVMEVLAKRKENSDDPGKTALEAWESFQQHYLPDTQDSMIHTPKAAKSVRYSSSWLRRLTAVAVVIILVICLSATANAFGWQELWNTVAQWAKETFSFVTDSTPQDTEPAAGDVRQYMSFQELLTKAGQRADLIPTWIPDGYVLQDIMVDETPVRKSYFAFYSNGDKVIKIGIQSYVDIAPEKIEANGDLLEIYMVSPSEYHIFTNNQLMCAAWIKDSYECYISGDLTIETIKMMIDSIGKG